MFRAGRYLAITDLPFTILGITVNGKHVKAVTFQNTGSWDKQWPVMPVTVNLRAGSNQVRLGNADNFAQNIGCMRVERQ